MTDQMLPELPLLSIRAAAGDATTGELHRWGNELHLLRERDMKTVYLTTRVGEFAAYAYPLANRQGRVLADQWCLWTLLVDQLVEWEVEQGTLTAQPSASNEPVSVLSAVSSNGRQTGPLMHALEDLHGRTLPILPAPSRALFLAHVAEFVRSCHVEAINRIVEAGVTIEEFIVLRRGSFATNLFLDLVEPLTGAFLPEHEEYQAIGQEMRDCAADIGGWCNDVLSYRREQGREDGNNLVLMLGAKHDCPPGEAVPEVLRMISERAWRFIALKSELAIALRVGELGDAAAAQAFQWVHGVELLVSGSLTFQKISARWQEGRPDVDNAEVARVEGERA